MKVSHLLVGPQLLIDSHSSGRDPLLSLPFSSFLDGVTFFHPSPLPLPHYIPSSLSVPPAARSAFSATGNPLSIFDHLSPTVRPSLLPSSLHPLLSWRRRLRAEYPHKQPTPFFFFCARGQMSLPVLPMPNFVVEEKHNLSAFWCIVGSIVLLDPIHSESGPDQKKREAEANCRCCCRVRPHFWCRLLGGSVAPGLFGPPPSLPLLLTHSQPLRSPLSVQFAHPCRKGRQAGRREARATKSNQRLSLGDRKESHLQSGAAREEKREGRWHPERKGSSCVSVGADIAEDVLPLPVVHEDPWLEADRPRKKADTLCY